MTNQRKHYQQMTEAEREAMKAYIRGINWGTRLNPHLMERMTEKHITPEELLYVLQNGTPVEAHRNNAPQVRFVMRATVKPGKDVCVCASRDGSVITAWVNHSNDHHRTLRVEEYQWHTDLTRVFATR
jgi:hypothetical protein